MLGQILDKGLSGLDWVEASGTGVLTEGRRGCG